VRKLRQRKSAWNDTTNARLEELATWNDLSLTVQSLYFPPYETPQPRNTPNFAGLHYHEYIELIYTQSGTVWAKVGSQQYTMHAGDLLIVRENTPHTFSTPYQREYVCIKFLPKLLYGDDQSLLSLRYLLPLLFDDNGGCLFQANQLSNIDLDGLFQSLVEEGESKQFGFQMIMRAEVLKLFGWILRRTGANLPVLDIPIQTEQIMRKALEYIETNLPEVTLHDTAVHCGLSYNYFSRLFRRTLHKSFSEYVSSLRIELAARKLSEEATSVEEIGYAVGFGSTSYFISKFKEAKGLSPHQFRKAVLISEQHP